MARIASDQRARSVVATLSVGPINGASFLACVDQAPLVPTLRPGVVVVLQNLGSHKGRSVRAAGAHMVVRPPYSPDLNPIEQAFAKLKRLLGKAAKRTIQETWRTIGGLVEPSPPKNVEIISSTRATGRNGVIPL